MGADLPALLIPHPWLAGKRRHRGRSAAVWALYRARLALLLRSLWQSDCKTQPMTAQRSPMSHTATVFRTASRTEAWRDLRARARATSAERPEDRIVWFDYAKGICITLVVMMHSTLGVGDAMGGEGF